MNAQELRIGNWVTYGSSDQTTEQVYDIWFDVDEGVRYINDLIIDLISPIPLTLEILIATGFIMEGNGVRYGKVYSTGGEWITVSLMQHNHGFWVIINTKHNEGINIGTATSLHQLQNIFYFLSGEELNYKPLKL